VQENQENVQIQIITPPGMMGPEEGYLVESIIRAVAEYYASDGEWADKYGLHHEDNPVFSMKSYCWCEEEDCRWCKEDGEPNFHYKPLDLKVWWYKYIGRDMHYNKGISIPECADMFKACIDYQNK